MAPALFNILSYFLLLVTFLQKSNATPTLSEHLTRTCYRFVGNDVEVEPGNAYVYENGPGGIFVFVWTRTEDDRIALEFDTHYFHANILINIDTVSTPAGRSPIRSTTGAAYQFVDVIFAEAEGRLYLPGQTFSSWAGRTCRVTLTYVIDSVAPPAPTAPSGHVNSRGPKIAEDSEVPYETERDEAYINPKVNEKVVDDNPKKSGSKGEEGNTDKKKSGVKGENGDNTKNKPKPTGEKGNNGNTKPGAKEETVNSAKNRPGPNGEKGEKPNDKPGVKGEKGGNNVKSSLDLIGASAYTCIPDRRGIFCANAAKTCGRG